jgi:hypothetical protein
MSIWTNFNVNGALADSLVTDFGGASSPTVTPYPPDCELCLKFWYSSSAATQVLIFLATAAGAAAQNTIPIWNSANQTPTADSTQFLPMFCVSVPIIAGTQQPMQLRITKAASTAIIRAKWTPIPGPGC